jgi:hypothetical protein
MRRRGVLFLIAGVLLFAAATLKYNRRAYAEHLAEKQRGWDLFAEPTTIEEGAEWAGIFSAILGGTFLVIDLTGFVRRRSG